MQPAWNENIKTDVILNLLDCKFYNSSIRAELSHIANRVSVLKEPS